MKHSVFNLLAITFYGLLLSCNQYATSDKKDLAEIGNKCIEQLFALDDSLGKVRNHACNTISLSETIDQYYKGINEADFLNCPEKFQIAYKNHQKAWLDIKNVTEKYPELRGEMHDLFDKIKSGKDSSVFKQYLDAIWNTWAEVEKNKVQNATQ
jgi:hypothetical protein